MSGTARGTRPNQNTCRADAPAPQVIRQPAGQTLEGAAGHRDAAEDQGDGVRHPPGARLEVAFDGFHCRRIERNLAGQEHEPVHGDRLGAGADGCRRLVGHQARQHLVVLVQPPRVGGAGSALRPVVVVHALAFRLESLAMLGADGMVEVARAEGGAGFSAIPSVKGPFGGAISNGGRFLFLRIN